jgi:hypothetical protein
MSKPKLSVELVDPNRIYLGGDKVVGVVRVEVDKDVACDGLVIQTAWRTHGRGNIASGTGQSITAFQGQWQAGEQLEYPFELEVADWPPSYHGHYLNVDHYVDARAKIAWAFDPKASAAFLMRPLTASVKQAPKEINSVVAKTFIAVFILIVFGAILSAGIGVVVGLGWFGVPFLLLPIGGLAFWVLRIWLPKYLLGEVQCDLKDLTVYAGDELKGELILNPRRSVPINGITIKVEGLEQVVSGSGSNKTTHRHVFFDHEETLREAGTLTPGAELRLPIGFKVPGDAPYTLALSSNSLIWTLVARIDIPRWPDWTKKIIFTVVPSGQTAAAATADAEFKLPDAADQSGAGITFEETVNHLWQVRSDPDQRDILVDAVAGITFPVSAVIERRLLYGGDKDANVYPNGHSVWARVSDPELPLVLFVPHEMGEEFEQLGRQEWTGRATVVGWDHDHGRLQLAVET